MTQHPAIAAAVENPSYTHDEGKIDRPVTGVRLSTAGMAHNAPRIAVLSRAGAGATPQGLWEHLTEWYYGTMDKPK